MSSNDPVKTPPIKDKGGPGPMYGGMSAEELKKLKEEAAKRREEKKVD